MKTKILIFIVALIITSCSTTSVVWTKGTEIGDYYYNKKELNLYKNEFYYFVAKKNSKGFQHQLIGEISPNTQFKVVKKELQRIKFFQASTYAEITYRKEKIIVNPHLFVISDLLSNPITVKLDERYFYLK